MSKKAVTYTRSSKDRAEVSLSSQLDELKLLASKNDLEIVRGYEDAVFSGSSDDRPGFQELIAAIKDRARGWSHVLVYDTSRIARGRFIAQAFRRECKRHGVELLIARMPETDPVSAVILESVFEAMDEVHSIMSRDKGMAGMRQNVTKGWRAGGRAPFGYRLVHEPTGAIRDGRPVLKSKLAPSADAEKAAKYLEGRAAGKPRHIMKSETGIDLPVSTLIDIEWNALVYAGHTVWNRHREKKTRGTGASRRRPREEWMINRNTHPALISELQAEAILAYLQTSSLSAACSKAKTHSSDFLLAGLLFTSDGRQWVGAGERYRLKPTDEKRGRYVSRKEMDEAVIETVRRDAKDEDFLQRLAEATRQCYPEHDPGKDLEREAAKLEREAERAAKLALETADPAPFISLMEAKRRQAAAVRHQADAARKDAAVTQAARMVTTETARNAVGDDPSPYALIRGLVARVILEPDLTCRIDYLPALDRSLSVASPRGSVTWAISSVVGL